MVADSEYIEIVQENMDLEGKYLDLRNNVIKMIFDSISPADFTDAQIILRLASIRSGAVRFAPRYRARAAGVVFTKCRPCNGTGVGIAAMGTPCDTCKGKGRVLKDG